MSGEGPLVVHNDEARLAEALRRCGVEVGSVGGHHFRRVVASRLLESDWLASYVARRESEAAEKALREAAELVSDANAQGLGLGAAYRSILREADSVAQGREEGGK
jgi:hypothetical protein